MLPAADALNEPVAMRTFQVASESGEQHAFELEHIYLTRGALRSIVSSIPGVSSVTVPRSSGEDREIRLQFIHEGVRFHVWEPFGDNSRYWIGPEDADAKGSPSQLRTIEEAFQRYRPPLLLKILGDVLSLNFKALFSGT